jgi:hypothetical protein
VDHPGKRVHVVYTGGSIVGIFCGRQTTQIKSFI